ncbi:MAG TPA: glutamyl-tRNA reductase [Anaerolineae bacterium]
MTILCLGVSFRTASIELREQLSLSKEAVATALGRFCLWRGEHLGTGAELVLLSTCNRLELYLAAPDYWPDAADALIQFMADECRVPPTQLQSCVTRYDGLEAVQHLCRVAAGLDSMVLGESQILGQVSDTYEVALRAGTAEAVVSAVFRAAIRAGKRAQTETTIGQNPVSAGSVAVRLAEQVMGSAALPDARVLVVGAGEMAELVVKALHARGVSRLIVANRTQAHADVLAQRWSGTAFDLAHLDLAIAQVDVVITSTGSPTPIILAEPLRRVMESRPERPLVLIDIGVPRDIEPAVGSIAGVRLFNLDDLQSNLDASHQERQAQVPFAEAIVADELAEFARWLRGAEVHPVITDLRRKAEAIRQHEMERALRHLPDLDPKTREYIQGLSRALVNKLLHEPTSKLRDAANDGQGIEYANSVRYLFGLNGDEPLQASGRNEHQ